MLYPPIFSSAPTEIKSDLEIIIKDSTPSAFQQMLECIYTDTTEVTSANVAELIAIAKKYHIEKLQILCSDFMSADLNVDNALELYSIAADILGDNHFGMKFIADECEAILKGNACKQLNKERFLSLLDEDSLNIAEIDIFNAVIEWGKERLLEQKILDDKDALKEVLCDILPKVRFPLMSITDLAEHVASTNLLDESVLLKLFTYVSVDPDQRGKLDSSLPYSIKERGGCISGRSSIISSANMKDLGKMFDTKLVRMTLLYDGSKDGFGANSFHSKCDDQTDIVIFIEATAGNIFGGYSSKGWNSIAFYSMDPKAFLFSFKNYTKKTVCLLPNQSNSPNMVYSDKSYGPTFGAGHDLHVNGNMKGNTNYCNPTLFKKHHKTFPSDSVVDNKLLAGSYNWTVKSIEAFRVVLKK